MESYFLISDFRNLPVSYTHLTLPTIYSVEISVVAVLLKKKKIQMKEQIAYHYYKIRRRKAVFYVCLCLSLQTQ